MRLHYCPLEPMKERYSWQLSAPITGWMERNWIKAGINYLRIDPIAEGKLLEPPAIATGVALDAHYRSQWCFRQVESLLELSKQNGITSNDVIYFDDFWHPGIECLAYTFHLLGIKPRMYANLWAQSVDKYDFTYPMRRWMRHYEKGNGKILSGIFVACPSLQQLVIDGGIADADKVHAVGHPFSSEEVRTHMPQQIQMPWLRKDQVVFSSRWDSEKDPRFFLSVARAVKGIRPEVKFIVCTSAPKIRSNDPTLLASLTAAVEEGLVEVHEGLSKEEYYHLLYTSKVQMNTAKQDWISYTLLETSVAGCYPLYPYFRSFPEVLKYQDDYMYEPHNVDDAVSRLLSILENDSLWSSAAIEDRAWIHTRFDTTWQRMLRVMGLLNGTDIGWPEE